MADEPMPVERKVTVASLTAFIVGTVMSYVLMVWPSMPDTVSQPLAAAVTGVVTGAFTFVFAWLAKHTNRNDSAAVAQGKNKPTQ
jgi:uncharacterized membrane protein YdcZ (DUF606 family)